MIIQNIALALFQMKMTEPKTIQMKCNLITESLKKRKRKQYGHGIIPILSKTLHSGL